jgi:hypothetical protein
MESIILIETDSSILLSDLLLGMWPLICIAISMDTAKKNLSTEPLVRSSATLAQLRDLVQEWRTLPERNAGGFR